MAQKQLKGVGGVLSNLITPSEPPPPSTPEAKPEESLDVARVQVAVQPEEQRPSKPPEPPAVVKAAKLRKKEGARRGRPPSGSRPAEPVEREKVSLRLRADLAATYRDWSWEEHCQFSDLVDRALEFYLRSRGKARKPERE